ncbi:DUF4352 domain-containing protein [Actinomadura roseirufa]|uniref:DUF4352 domain-containing protein n=1 Tax=Actinomadura roseirufa TaxID=2094049 RepID=UPI0010417B16|nr:DUF4352 domain-containing protein [Actinomadura roseirufa]
MRPKRPRPSRLQRPRAARAGAALLLAAALQGCSGSSPHEYRVPAEKAREDESTPEGKAGRSADLQFTVLGFREQMAEVMGTHTAMGAHGTFTRIRLLAVNTGRDIQVFDAWKQRLVTADGRVLTPDVNATMIKRQPERLSVGAAMRVEFDLWFDVPRGARAKAVRLYGSPPVGAVSDPAPTEIPLP